MLAVSRLALLLESKLFALNTAVDINLQPAALADDARGTQPMWKVQLRPTFLGLAPTRPKPCKELLNVNVPERALCQYSRNQTL